MPKYKFSDIATNVTEKRMPVPEDKLLYIAPNNLDTDTLTVPEYGYKVDLNGVKLVMHKGDMLFGRREPQLKKAAIAPHDGLFSAHGMIFHPKKDVILPEFFPFFIASDYFMDVAIRISVGSLSPTVNWRDLKDVEFEIPSLDVQKRYAELLWSVIESKRAYKELIAQTEELVKAQYIELFGDPVENPMGWPTKPLTDMGDCKNGMNFKSDDAGITINCLGVGDFKDFDVIEDTAGLSMVSLNSMPSEDYYLKDGDIVFVRSNGNKTMVGRSVIVFPGDTPTVFSGFCIRYRNKDDSILVPYLLYVLKADSMRKQMYGRGANIQNLNQKTLSSLNIPLPPKELQQSYVDFVKQSNKANESLQNSFNQANAMHKAILKEIFPA